MPTLEQQLEGISQIPLHRFLGVRGLDSSDGRASLKITVNENTANPAGMLHGGVAYALCDVVSYAALLPQLAEGEQAVTHDIQVSVMRAARLGDEVEFTGKVEKQGARIAFLDAQACVNGKVVASARVTKSILNRD